MTYRGVSDDTLYVEAKGQAGRFGIPLASVTRVEVSAGRYSAQYGMEDSAGKVLGISAAVGFVLGFAIDLNTRCNGCPAMAFTLPLAIGIPAMIVAGKYGHDHPPDIWERVLWRSR